MNCSTGSAPSPPGFATEAEALYNVLLTFFFFFFFPVFGIGSELDVAQASVGNTLFSSSGQPLAAGLGSRYVSKGHRDLKGLEMISNLTLYDFSSLCVCIYKYICVFIFNIEHTHMISTPTAHVLTWAVCCG